MLEGYNETMSLILCDITTVSDQEPLFLVHGCLENRLVVEGLELN